MKKRIVAMGMALVLTVVLTPTVLAQQTKETTAEQDNALSQLASETVAEPTHTSAESAQARVSATYEVPGTNIVLNYAIEQENEWLYGVETPYVEITGCNSDGAGVLTIPSELEGIPVKVIDWKELTSVHDLQGIIVPEGVEVLTDFRFSISALQFVYLPSTIQLIDEEFPMLWYNAPTELFFGGSRDQTFLDWRDQEQTVAPGLFEDRGGTETKSQEALYVYYNVDPSSLICVKMENYGGEPGWYSEKYYMLGDETPVYGYLGSVDTSGTDLGTFKGWFTKPEGGVQVTKDTPLQSLSDHTIYARFENSGTTVDPEPDPDEPENPDDTYTGWRTEDGKDYWYENGVKQGTEGRGKEIYDPDSDAWYWLDAVQGGAKAVSKDVYQESDAGQWADNPDGTGKWVRYDAEGHMVKGWQVTSTGTYYFDEVTGAMAKGVGIIANRYCAFDPITGHAVDMQWQNENGNEYWYEGGIRQGCLLNDDGTPDLSYRGKEIYDPATSSWYWLDNVDYGKKAVNKDVYQESDAGQWAENDDGTGKWVRYDGDGHMIKGWQTNSSGTYYFDPVYGTMIKGCATIDGSDYYFDWNTGIRQTGDVANRMLTAKRVVDLVNQQRAAAGVGQLKMDGSVTQVAMLRAQELTQLFSHTRPNGTSCFTALQEAGIFYWSAGENIAWGQQSPELVMNSWMNSTGHRQNILNSTYTKIGVGYYVQNGRPYWVQMFIYN